MPTGGVRGATIWITGLSGSGKTTLARLVATELRRRGRPVEVLDGDAAFPRLTRAVAIDLDAVTIGIGEVDRLADVVVGQPDERHAVARGAGEPGGELRPLGDEEREVVEARVAS